MAGKRKRSRSRTRKVSSRRKASPRQKADSRRTTTAPRKAAAPHQKAKKPASRRRQTEEELQGPPPREATLMRSDRERAAERRLAEPHGGSPRLAGGDVDADWERAGSTGEEAVGGSVATPDKSVVDDLGDALGVGRAPDAPVRTSQEILEERDARRHRQED